MNGVLIPARHNFLVQDKRLEDWELIEALDGDIVPVDGLWEAAGPADRSMDEQTMFRRVVGWYLATRADGGGLTFSPTSGAS